jgi:hypothetical protein
MAAAFYLLLVIGHLGFFDVLYFHIYRCGLHHRPECQREVFWHTMRHLIYGSQFLAIANLRFHGAALLALGALYAADIYIAWADVWEETASRRALGGLPRGEYFMHVVLSVLVGCYLATVVQAVLPDARLATAVVVDPPPVPAWLRAYMTLMGVSAIGLFAFDLRRWLSYRAAAAAVS